MKKPILCLDFDGVLHSYTSGWQGADVVSDEPVTGAIGFLLMAVQHFDVCIFSSRSNQKGGIAAMRNWLKRHADGAWYESPAGPGIEDVRFVTEKPPALLTIDDRAVQFTGEWPSLEFISDFTPWNKLSAIVHPAARAPADSVLEDAALPMQPICVASDGIVRFKKNRMVNDLYEFSQPRGFGLNEMARRDYTQEERMQFAQLIGYSVSGYGSLSYASPESVEKADAIADLLIAARKQGANHD